jgi:integral membrane sensor domain MASE1
MPEIAASHKSLIRFQPWRVFSRFDLPRDLVLPILIGPAYYAGTKLGLLFTPPFQPISTLWPPNALLFAVLLLTPVRTWPLSLIAVLPAHLLVQLNSGIPALTSLGWYVTNTLEALLGASCLRIFCRRQHISAAGLFKSFQGVICFVVFGVLMAPFVTSFLDAAVVVTTGWGTNFWNLWIERLLSNMLANLTLIPPIVVISSERRWGKLGKWRYVEAGLLGLAIMVIVGTVLRVNDSANGIPALIYLLLPFLLWAAVRFGSSGASASLLFTALLAIRIVLHNRGTLGPLSSEVLSLQVFLSAINVPLLCLAAVFEERREIEAQLRRHQSLLTMVSQIGAKFININWKRIDDEINLSLTRLRSFLNVDWVEVFEFTKQDRFRLCYSARVELDSETSARLPVSQLVWLIDELSLGKAVSIADVNDLRTETVERRTLTDAGVRAMLMVPLGTQPSLAGSLSVVSIASKKDWPSVLVPQLQILGEIFYDAMLRKNAFQALTESGPFSHAGLGR